MTETNIVSFDDLDSTQQIGALQVGLPRVILEGKDDVYFFNTWFNHLLDALVFVEADQVKQGAGCSAVAEAVRYSVEDQGVPAIGIVDRDSLFRKKDWPTLFAVDDAAFSAIQTPQVLTTQLWEVEAYLIRPEVLSNWVRINTKNPPVAPQAVANVVSDILRECEALLETSPVFAAAHVGKVLIADGWGLDFKHDTLCQECEAKHAGVLQSEKATATSVRAQIEAIKAAAPNAPTDRLLYLLQYVNTKKLFKRLLLKLQLNPKAHFALAELMSLLDLRPSELEQIVEAHADAFAA